jgi:MerR family redox-sensitive transcriptional activator SoxR
MKSSKAKSNASRELTVGEVAARTGLSVSAIQFYESKGLITGMRTAGRRRRYPHEVLKSVALIRTAQSVGIPLKSLHEMLTSFPAGRIASKEEWIALLRVLQTDIKERVTQLQALSNELANCSNCGCLSPEVCPLLEHEHEPSLYT